METVTRPEMWQLQPRGSQQALCPSEAHDAFGRIIVLYSVHKAWEAMLLAANPCTAPCQCLVVL